MTSGLPTPSCKNRLNQKTFCIYLSFFLLGVRAYVCVIFLYSSAMQRSEQDRSVQHQVRAVVVQVGSAHSQVTPTISVINSEKNQVSLG